MLQKKISKLLKFIQKNRLKINYLTASPEKLKEIEKYDVILNLEIIEHVEDVNLYLKSCFSLLKKWFNVYGNFK